MFSKKGQSKLIIFFERMSVCLDAELGLVSKSKPSHLDCGADDGKHLGLVDIAELQN